MQVTLMEVAILDETPVYQYPRSRVAQVPTRNAQTQVLRKLVARPTKSFNNELNHIIDLVT